jgi:cytochrome c peroxidase
MPRSLLAALLISGLTVSGALAGAVTFLDRSPADPAVIDVEVDQSQLQGVLSPEDLELLIEAGRRLFAAKFTSADGAGRPLATQATIPTHFKQAREVAFQRASGPDANACTSCHNTPLAGGAGDFTANAFTSEGTESADFDNVDPQFSNERGTNHMFGSGLIELLAREMTNDLHALRAGALAEARETGATVALALESKGVDFGEIIIAPNGQIDVSRVEGVDDDLVLRPFSQKGVITSLRLFTVNALNAHHGIQGDERFGAAMTGEADFDGDGLSNELSPGAVSALVAWQASLAPPLREPFERSDWQAAADRGERLFSQVGCAACHLSALPLNSLIFADPGMYDTAGTLSFADVEAPAIYDLMLLDWAKSLPRDENDAILVPLFGDLKRHVIADDEYSHFSNELLGQSFVPRTVFMTAELWGVADTAPYGHRGDLTTLAEVTLAHGGEARASRDAFEALDPDAQDDLITFLMTLRMPR